MRNNRRVRGRFYQSSHQYEHVIVKIFSAELLLNKYNYTGTYLNWIYKRTITTFFLKGESLSLSIGFKVRLKMELIIS